MNYGKGDLSNNVIVKLWVLGKEGLLWSVACKKLVCSCAAQKRLASDWQREMKVDEERVGILYKFFCDKLLGYKISSASSGIWTFI